MPELVKSIPITLDKPRKLRFDFNAMAIFQDTTGVSPLNMGAKMMEPKNLRALLWACLRDDDPDITIEAVGHEMGPANIEMIKDKLVEAFGAAMPEATPAATPAAKTKKRPQT